MTPEELYIDLGKAAINRLAYSSEKRERARLLREVYKDSSPSTTVSELAVKIDNLCHDFGWHVEQVTNRLLNPK